MMMELTDLKGLVMTNQIRYEKRNDYKVPGFGRAWIHHVLDPTMYSSCGPRCRRREGNGTPLQYSCLENLMDGRAW